MTNEQEIQVIKDIKDLISKGVELNQLAEQLHVNQQKCLLEVDILNELISDSKLSPEFKQTISKYKTILSYYFPKKPNFVLELALGKSAPFLLRPANRRLEYKREYEVFKLRMTLLSCGFAFVCLFITSRIIDAVYAFLLLYYYCTIVLREHILIVNGSRIKNWWLIHHYLSIVTSGVLLIWPSSNSYDAFRDPFLWFSLYLGVLQYLQYRYQQHRLYVLIALQKAGPMDTMMNDGVYSDGIGWDFLLLLPFSIVGQIFQIYSSFVMLREYEKQTRKEWQLAVLGIVFMILGLGNMIATFQIYFSKSVNSNKKKN